MSEILSITERKELSRCKETISEGLKAYKEMGQAFFRIKEGRLYREAAGSFTEFCRVLWNVTPTFVNDCIRAAEVAENLEAAGIPAPLVKTQAKELSKLSKEGQVEAWTKTLQETKGNPTTEKVRQYSRAPKSGPVYTRKSVHMTQANWKYVEQQARARNISPSNFISDLVFLDRKESKTAKGRKK